MFVKLASCCCCDAAGDRNCIGCEAESAEQPQAAQAAVVMRSMVHRAVDNSLKDRGLHGV
jgi:hypothetical protein